MPSREVVRDTERRAAIIDAALACFLQFGFAKTSLDDIARRAGLSRPLLYRKYDNKEAIFRAVYDHVFDSRYPRAEQIVAGRGSRRDRLLALYDVVVAETWDVMMRSPTPSEFHDACSRLLPDAFARHARKLFELTRKLLGDRDVSHVFMLAVDGLLSDVPSTAVLRKRLEIIVDRFAR